jgi:hypothetical protein
LVQRTGASTALAFGPALARVDAAALPLVLLTPGMHNRQWGDAGLAVTGRQPESVIETDSVLALLVTSTLHTPGLLACPLCSPALCTLMAFSSHGSAPLTLTLRAAWCCPQSDAWRAALGLHSGALDAGGLCFSE